MPKQFNREKVVFSTSSARTIGYPCVKKKKKSVQTFIYLTPYTEMKSKWIVDLSVKVNTRHLQKNVVKNLYDLGLSREFLDMKPDAQHAKLLSRGFNSCAHEIISIFLC